MQKVSTEKKVTKITEELLVSHFNDVKILEVWKESAKKLQEQKQRLENRVERGIPVVFADNVNSPVMSEAMPSNRGHQKGMETIIERAIEEENRIIKELASIGIDLVVTENTIGRLEQSTFTVSEALRQLEAEAIKVLELKLLHNKSYDEIGERLRKSKSSAHRLYEESLKTAHKWLKSVGVARFID